MATTFLPLLVAVSVSTFPAQDTLPSAGTLSGLVTTRAGQPLERAVVILLPSNDTVLTSAEGRFTFRGLEAGPWVLHIRALGQEPRYVVLTLGDRSGWRGALVLEDLAQELPEIRVDARWGKPARYAGTTRYDDFFRRQRIGFGTFIDRDQIERRGASHFVQLLDGIPGVRARWAPPGTNTVSTIQFSRCRGNPPPVAFYINGARAYATGLEAGGSRAATLMGTSTTPGVSAGPGSRPSSAAHALSDFLASISPSEIEMIEVYRSPSEIPGDLARENNCAVIVIWTR